MRIMDSLLATLNGHTNWIYALSFSPDGTLLASGGWEHTVRLWDITTFRSVGDLNNHSTEIYCLKFSSDGRLLASGSANNDSGVRLWNVPRQQLVTTLKGHTNVVHAVSFSPDDQFLSTGSYDKTVRIWDVSTGTEQIQLSGNGEQVYGVGFSQDGKSVLSVTARSHLTRWLLSGTNPIVTQHKFSYYAHAVALSSDARQLAAGYGTKRNRNTSPLGEVRVWDVVTGEEQGCFQGHEHWVYSVAFSDNGKRMVSGGWDGKVKLWDLETGQEIVTLGGHQGIVLSAVFSPDQQLLASAGYDQKIRLWDLSHWSD